MKKLMYIAALSGVIGISSCNKKENNAPAPSVREFTVSSYNSVEVTGNVVVVNNANADPGSVVVRGNPALIRSFSVTTNGDMLVVKANSSAQLEDSIYVEIGAADLDSIILTAQQQAVFRWVDPEREALTGLHIETRGGSRLWFYGLRAQSVDLELKGNSEVYLDSRVDTDRDSVEIAAAGATLEGNYVIEGNIVYRGESIETVTRDSTDYYVIYGSEIHSYYIVDDMKVRTVGTTYVRATDCAVRDMEIYLTGNSEAEVWVMENITGEGSGSSVLRYTGDPSVAYLLTGSAQILNL